MVSGGWPFTAAVLDTTYEARATRVHLTKDEFLRSHFSPRPATCGNSHPPPTPPQNPLLKNRRGRVPRPAGDAADKGRAAIGRPYAYQAIVAAVGASNARPPGLPLEGKVPRRGG